MTAEYARAYGGVPRADQSWHEVLALVRRVRRFEARHRLALRDGFQLGQATSEDSLAQMELARLRRIGGA